ncbi:hypothetical protein MP638_006667 [Amoeboaphelidium occidentale]|nr:hypothetical protein MP638_006667 [Amoeboaphelidium occidentale]
MDREAKLKELGSLRDQISKLADKHPDLGILTDKATTLLEEIRMNGWDLDLVEPRKYLKPSSNEIMLLDVKSKDLHESIATALNVAYLGPASAHLESKFSVDGMLFGPHSRPFVSLVVESPVKKIKLNMIFFVDTGSPHVYICQEAAFALGFKENIPESFRVQIGDVMYMSNLSPSDKHFSDMNVLGASFFQKSRAKIEIDYKNETVKLAST